MSVTAGVIGVQGDVSEHADAIQNAASFHGTDVTVREIRRSGIVPTCDLLLLPGGESTTISRLLFREGIAEEIQAHVAANRPLLATCAGLIVAARTANDHRVKTLNLLDITVDRNAFGRQRDSFETHITVTDLKEPFPAVFIRAPIIHEVGSTVDVLAVHDGHIVAVRDGPVIGTAFHPELTNDHRIHDLAFFKNDSPPE